MASKRKPAASSTTISFTEETSSTEAVDSDSSSEETTSYETSTAPSKAKPKDTPKTPPKPIAVQNKPTKKEPAESPKVAEKPPAAKPFQPPPLAKLNQDLAMQRHVQAAQDASIQEIAMTKDPKDRKTSRMADVRVLRERIRDHRDRFQDVSESLKCGICGSIFLDPVQIVHIDCNHIYCERCLETRTTEESLCPECGFHFAPKLVKPAANIQNIILDQLVPCFFEPAGCLDRIRFRDLEDHERRCLYNPDRLVECICGEEMPVSKHSHHLGNDCPEFAFDCPHGCGSKVKRKNLQRHEDYECIMKPVRCEFAKFGCTFKGPRSDLYKHNKEQFQSHMGMMASRIQDLESETKRMHVENREQAQQMLKQPRGAKGFQDPHIVGGNEEGDFGGFQRSYDQMMPELGRKSSQLYTTGDAKLKRSTLAPQSDQMFDGTSDRVMPKGLSKINDLMRPKWNRQCQPKKVIESPRDGTYRFVRPYACAFVSNEQLVMTDCKTAWLIDVETGAVRNTMDPLSVKERQLYRPRGVCVQESGLRVFVADSQGDCVHMFTPSGEYSTSFGKGKLKYPLGITSYRNRVYVCDTHHNTMQIFDSAGTHVGNLVDDYHGTPCQAVSSENTGLLYVTMNSTSDSYVLVCDHLGEFVTTFGVKGDDVGTLNQARGVAVDQHENVYVSNANPYRIQMFAKIPTKISVRETRRWENKVREQIWLEEMEKQAAQFDDGADDAKSKSQPTQQEREMELSFEQKVTERLRKRPTEMTMPRFEYRVCDWLGQQGDNLSSPCGLAISPNKQMLAVVDEIKNKLYIY